MVVSTPLVFGTIDTLFGGRGSGKVKIEGREYTAIETRLIGKLTMMALEVLKDAWSPVHAVDFVYVRSEFNPLAIAIVPPTDVVIIVTVEVELEQDSTTLTICIPYSTIEPIRQKLTQGFQSTRLEVDNTALKRMDFNVRKTGVELSVELARGAVKGRSLANLKPGDIIPLDTSPTDEAIIRVEGIPKYRGYVGTFRGSRAVRVTSAVLPPDSPDTNTDS
jgi:flagellar motor switch protein FliM